MVVLFTVTKETIYILIGLILIVIIIIMYYSLRKDSFEVVPTDFELPRRHSDYYDTNTPVNNPLKNVPITDYDKSQDYSEATRSDSTMSKFIDGKIFQTADQYIFDKNTRQFYTTANSSVPNKQNEFANWLYGVETVCKEGSIYMNRTGTPSETTSCNGFNVASPTNFGNLNDYIAPSNE
jgi:hypothetical protein